MALTNPQIQPKIQMGLVNIWATELKEKLPLSYSHTPKYEFTATDSTKQKAHEVHMSWFSPHKLSCFAQQHMWKYQHTHTQTELNLFSSSEHKL